MPNVTEVPAFMPKQITACHLQAVYPVGGCLHIPTFMEEFKKLLQRGHGKGDGYKGQYITGTIVSICTSDNKTEETRKILKELGFKLLGIQEGAHSNIYNKYKAELWGLGFKLPTKEKE
jgi:hypothetical protein